MTSCFFADNQAVSAGSATVLNSYIARGGALNNDQSSTAQVSNSCFADNQAIGGAGGQESDGGAIGNFSGGTLQLTTGTFTGNQAIGGSKGGGEAHGGALANSYASATISQATFLGNTALGGDGGNADLVDPVGDGVGGAIVNEFGGNMVVDSCPFVNNRAIGGNGGNGGVANPDYAVDIAGGGAITNIENLTVSNSSFVGNLAEGGNDASGGPAGQGVVGSAFGGAIQNLARPPSQPAPSIPTWPLEATTTKDLTTCLRRE